MTDLFVRRIYEYEGIKVMVEIDFVNEKISLIDKENGQYKPKKWIFGERQLQYMNGWLRILAAMEYAIKEATAELQAVVDKKTEDYAKLIIATSQALKPEK
jgi:hypothetical protein